MKRLSKASRCPGGYHKRAPLEYNRSYIAWANFLGPNFILHMHIYTAELLTIYLHCRVIDCMSTLQSYWLDVYTAQLLTVRLHCRVTDCMSTLHSCWPYVYTAELLTVCLHCRVADCRSTLQSCWLYIYTAELLTAYLHCTLIDRGPTCFQAPFPFHMCH
jgi:hypothetical protein